MLPYVPDDSMIHECFSECKTLLRKRYFLPRIVQNCAPTFFIFIL